MLWHPPLTLPQMKKTTNSTCAPILLWMERGGSERGKVDFLVARPLTQFRWRHPTPFASLSYSLPRLRLKFKHIWMRIKKAGGKRVARRQEGEVRQHCASLCCPSALGSSARRSLKTKELVLRAGMNLFIAPLSSVGSLNVCKHKG